ncbi:MAG TPA: serine/threonine-protein kinase [Polyangiaceae bacterium]
MSAPTKREGGQTVPRPVKTPLFEPKAGLLVAGKYRVERVIGEGGMGIVVAAMHEGLDQKVAIKFLAPEAVRNQEVVERFMREAKVAAKVKSEHVARVSDVGRVDGNAPFIVMEYLEGADLAGMIDTQKALPIDEVCEIGLQACEALAEVHAAGIVHRDLKPSNLFITRRADGSPCLKLLDFGISKFTSMGDNGTDPALTATATVMGSPSYMSPEQLKSTKEVDARTDVWSLGAVLYEALTGKPAFRGETVPQVVAMIASEDPAIPSGIRQDIPSELETAVLACLVKNADQRSTLVGLARTLVRFAPERARPSLDRVESVLGAERSQKSMPIVAVKPTEMARTQSSWGEEEKARKRSGGSKLMFLATIAVIAVGIAVYTGKIDLRALGVQSASATGAASAAPSAKGAKPGASASATTTTITVPPIASIVAPIASVVEPVFSALAPAASSAPPASSAPAPAASVDETDAGDDGEEDDEETAATAPTGTVVVAGQPAAPRPAPAHPSTPKRTPSRPKHGKGWTHKHR